MKFHFKKFLSKKGFKIVSITPLSEHINSSTSIIKADKHYFCKIYKKYKPEKVRKEYSKLKMVYSKTKNCRILRIPQPVFCSPKRGIIITEHIKGETIYDLIHSKHRYFSKDSAEKYVRKAGIATREMHDSMMLRKPSKREKKGFIEYYGREINKIRKLKPSFLKYKEKINDCERWAFLHGDLHPMNMIYSGGKVYFTDLLDRGWDYGPIGFDLGKFIQLLHPFPLNLKYILMDRKNRKILENAYLEGYFQINPNQRTQRDNFIPLFKAFNRIYCSMPRVIDMNPGLKFIVRAYYIHKAKKDVREAF
ncbi:MAG: phosphotransferase [Candidatus Woesearchaeota archaeon]